jgi:hypothetical protein
VCGAPSSKIAKTRSWVPLPRSPLLAVDRSNRPGLGHHDGVSLEHRGKPAWRYGWRAGDEHRDAGLAVSASHTGTDHTGERDELFGVGFQHFLDRPLPHAGQPGDVALCPVDRDAEGTEHVADRVGDGELAAVVAGEEQAHRALAGVGHQQ